MLNRRQTLLGSISVIAANPFTALSEALQTPKRALVIVSLADNKYQGIVPTKAILGNGQDPANNLYWGAMYGVKSYFKRHADYDVRPMDESSPRGNWKFALDAITITPKNNPNIKIDAIANDGFHQDWALRNFYSSMLAKTQRYDLVVYVGHNPLMDIKNTYPFGNFEDRIEQNTPVKAVVLACQSKKFFQESLTRTNAIPYVMTKGNMAPEAYALEGIISAWMDDKPASEARLRAAQAYAKYQKIPLKNAKWLFDV